MQYIKSKHLNINDRYCSNYNKRLIKMDNFCNVYPCILYRLYKKDYKFEHNEVLNYSDIFNFVDDFCFECTTDIINFLRENNRD
jgi:hypothetical protein